MGEWSQVVASRRPIPASMDEWGPDCVRCGNEEYRIDGYCSCECRDVDELERELAQAEAENTLLRERGDALVKAVHHYQWGDHSVEDLHAPADVLDSALTAWRAATREEPDG